MTSPSYRILLVEDDPRYGDRLRRNLELEGWQVELAENGQVALEKLADGGFDLVMSDIKMPGMDGLELLHRIKTGAVPGADAELPVLMLTSVQSVQTAVQAMKEGAQDYLTKDSDREEIILRIQKSLTGRRLAAENLLLKQKLEQTSDYGPVIARSPVIQRIWQEVAEIAPSEATVLITGETGVGKDLLARAIHAASRRKDGPFVEVNCAALPDDNLLQSELFGHEKGAFTGAGELRRGKFEVVQGGTLFLDEIGDLSLDSQGKLLRALENKEFERLGGNRQLRVEARFILATNRPLLLEVEEKRFRKDLYYRINVVHLHLPPLRERKEDIPELAQTFLLRYADRYNKPRRQLSPEAEEVLERYSWPGNVRELRNICERLALRPGDSLVTPATLMSCGLGEAQESAPQGLIALPPEGISLEEIERQAIQAALERTGWVQKDAAALLRISVDRMNARVKRFGLTHPAWKVHRQ